MFALPRFDLVHAFQASLGVEGQLPIRIFIEEVFTPSDVKPIRSPLAINDETSAVGVLISPGDVGPVRSFTAFSVCKDLHDAPPFLPILG